MSPNVVWFWYIGAQRGENHIKTFFWGHSKNDLCVRKCSQKELPENVSSKFGEIRAKNLSHPQKFACSCTYELRIIVLLHLCQKYRNVFN